GVSNAGGATYQWRRGMTPLSNGGNIWNADTPTLLLNPAELTDAGDDYNCLLTDPCGSVQSNNASLTTFATGTGDGDNNGTVNGDDIPGMITALFVNDLTNPSCCAYDMNEDGTIDEFDVAAFVDAALAP